MPQEKTASRTVCPTPTEPATRQETTLRKAVVERVMLSFELDGLAKAREEFEQMRHFFSGNRDWPDIEEVVMAFFKERKWVEAQVSRIEFQKLALYKNTNPEVCVSRDNGVLRCKDRKKN